MMKMKYINLLLHIAPEPNESQLKDLAHRYTKNNAALDAFSQKFRNNYETLCLSTLQQYSTLPFKDRIKKLVQGWKTWDNYGLSIVYIKFIYYLTRAKNNKSLDNSFVKFMIQLLTLNIHPDFKRRLSVKTTLNRFDEFLGNTGNTEVGAIENIISHIEENKKSIDKSIIINARKIKSLTEKTIVREI